MVQANPQTPPTPAEPSPGGLRPGNVFYGWWLVALGGFVMTISTVPLFHAMSVWAVALESQFNWSRTQLGFALTFTRIEGGIMGPIEGYLTDKVGTRRMVLVGMVILGLGFLFFGRVENLWMFYAAYMVMALGQGLGSWVPVMTLLNHWFQRQKSTAISRANVISRVGALALVPALAWAVDPDADRLGWSLTATVIGIFILVIAFPMTRLIRNQPQEYGQWPDGVPPEEEPGQGGASRGTRSPSAADTGDFTAVQALKTPAFWLIALGHGFVSMVMLAVMSHLGLMMKDQGFTLQTTAWLVGGYTLVATVFQLVGGYVGDRIPIRLALFGFTTIQAVGVVVLTLADNIATLAVFAVMFGVGMGGRNPLTVSIRGDYFGRRSFGKILGLSTVPMNVLLLISSPLAGYMRDVQGTYTDAFLLLAALNFLGGICFLAAKRPTWPAAAQGRA